MEKKKMCILKSFSIFYVLIGIIGLSGYICSASDFAEKESQATKYIKAQIYVETIKGEDIHKLPIILKVIGEGLSEKGKTISKEKYISSSQYDGTKRILKFKIPLSYARLSIAFPEKTVIGNKEVGENICYLERYISEEQPIAANPDGNPIILGCLRILPKHKILLDVSDKNVVKIFCDDKGKDKKANRYCIQVNNVVRVVQTFSEEKSIEYEKKIPMFSFEKSSLPIGISKIFIAKMLRNYFLMNRGGRWGGGISVTNTGKKIARIKLNVLVTGINNIGRIVYYGETEKINYELSEQQELSIILE